MSRAKLLDARLRGHDEPVCPDERQACARYGLDKKLPRPWTKGEDVSNSFQSSLRSFLPFHRFSMSLVSFVVLFFLAALVLFSNLSTPAFMDHEGRYAEVAREMLLTGDWIIPHLNFTPFLNKPPLPYWLTAAAFLAFGPSEYARLWPAVVGLLLLGVVVLLGRAVAGQRAGLYSGLVLLTSGGFYLEGRLLRPDLLLTLLLCVSLLCFLKAVKADACARKKACDKWILLGAASLGVSVMTKGMVDVVLAGGVIVSVLFCCGRLSFVRKIPWPLALATAFMIVLPWHIAAGLRQEGFWWDYVVNQHVLFFFDQKFPRDSLPDPLPVFWGAFLGRTFPWSVWAPVALAWAVKRGWKERSPQSLLAPIWLLVVMGFFSLSPSRLEHYTIPALPAAALLVGCWWSHLTEQGGSRSWVVFAPPVLLGLLGFIGFAFAPSLLAVEAWAREFPVLTLLLRLVCGAMGVAGILAVILLWQGFPHAAFVMVAVLAAPVFWGTQQALLAIEPINSWKPVGVKLTETLPPEGEAIFVASDEYQICGGLNFYSKKPLSILLPDGYIPPTYLTLDGRGPFLTTPEFLERWQSERPVVLITDPEREDVDAVFSVLPSFVEIGRWGDRRMVGNQAFAEHGALMADSQND